MTPLSHGHIPRTLWVLLIAAVAAGTLAFFASVDASREGRAARRADVVRAEQVSRENQRILREVRRSQAAAHCTQDLILSILNDPEVQTRIRAGQPIDNPCNGDGDP